MTLQLPQWEGSEAYVSFFLQPPSQSSNPEEQVMGVVTHLPCTHDCPSVHFVLHSPQWSLSLDKDVLYTQTPLHSTASSLHGVLHLEFWHMRSPPHYEDLVSMLVTTVSG